MKIEVIKRIVDISLTDSTILTGFADALDAQEIDIEQLYKNTSPLILMGFDPYLFWDDLTTNDDTVTKVWREVLNVMIIKLEDSGHLLGKRAAQELGIIIKMAKEDGQI